MRKNQTIDVSDLTSEQIALIQEIITTFRENSQQKLVGQKVNQTEPENNELNLAERIKRRFKHIDNVNIPQMTRDSMRSPTQFEQ